MLHLLLVLAQVACRGGQIVVMHVVDVSGGVRMTRRNSNGFCTIYDIRERQQVVAAEMEEQRPHLQTNTVGKRASAWPIDYARAQNNELKAVFLLELPEELFLAEFREGIDVAQLRMRFERRRLVNTSASFERGYTVNAE